MAVDIRFDYYYLKIDKKRLRASDQGKQFFGDITVEEICQWLEVYYQANKNNFGEHGEKIIGFKHDVQTDKDKKWIRWISFEYDEEKNVYKMLCTFNDTEVDPRLLANQSDDVLTQLIPDTFGQRTLLHIVLKPNDHQNAYANISIQDVTGFRKDYVIRFFTRLVSLINDDEIFWKANDPMTQKEVLLKPNIELSPVTDDNVIQAINDGYLRGIMLSERTSSTSKFDTTNHIVEENARLTIKIAKDDSFFQKASKVDIFEWFKKVINEKGEAFKDPQTYLIIKDPQTGSEVPHEFINDFIMGFTKKAYVKWNDRVPDTHDQIKSEKPKPIPQFFAKMIENFE